MTAPPSFAEGIREILAELREHAPSHIHVNSAAGHIDHLGRQLYGLGLVRVHEVADCFTAAVGVLAGSHALPEAQRGPAVEEAVRQLEAALAHVEEGGLSAA